MTLTGKLHRCCTLIALLLAGVSVGCTGFKIEDGDVRHGILFYPPKPYLLVEGSDDMPIIRVVYLPDYAHPRSIVPKIGKSFDAGLDLGALVRSLTTDGGGAAPPTEEKAAATTDKRTGRAPKANLAPGLYEMVFDQGGKLSNLRRVELPTQAASSPASRAQALRFVPDPVSPEIPKEVVIATLGSEFLSCPPPELKVKGQLRLDGEREEDLCRKENTTCDAAAEEVHCRLSLKKAGVYEARAWTEQDGQVVSMVEGSFPKSAEGFTPYRPQATVSLGRTADGSVKTIGIVFDRQSGSCLLKKDLESMVGLYGKDGAKLSPPKLGEMDVRGDSDCMTDVLYYLKEPRQEVAVRVRPQNRLGLVGKTVFATAEAAPPGTSPVNPAFAPVFSPTFSPSFSPTFSPAASPTISVLPPWVVKSNVSLSNEPWCYLCPPPFRSGSSSSSSNPGKGELTSVRGILNHQKKFSEFEVELTAPPDSLPVVHFCPAKGKQNRALEIEKNDCCLTEQGGNLELERMHEIPSEPGRYQGFFSFPPSGSRHLCFRVEIGAGTSFFSVDESLIGKPQPMRAEAASAAQTSVITRK